MWRELLIAPAGVALLFVLWVVVQHGWRRVFRMPDDRDVLSGRGGCSGRGSCASETDCARKCLPRDTTCALKETINER
jgi:hypothetical protein